MEILGRGEIVDGRYRIDKALGRGGHGVVYRAFDVDLERTCALKLLAVELPEGARESLRREAAALATLRSAHVVTVHAFGQHGGRPYFVMEFVAGRDLGALIDSHYTEHHAMIPLHRGLSLLRELCDGLSAVHGAGLVHRDLKPDNVVVEDNTGRVVLVDFGAAVLPGGWLGEITGTPLYMPPEAFDGAPPTVRGDLYSLGCLAFELLTGVTPFRGAGVDELGRAHQRAAIPKASSLRPELAPLDVLFEQLLAKIPEARPGRAAVVGNQLEDFLRMHVLGVAGSDGPSVELVVPADHPGVRVLVVDDDPLFARVAARCAQVALADSVVSVSRVATGAAALASAAKRRPDLIVLDYLLPDTNGVDLLSHLRSQHDGSHAEVLLASGQLGVRDRWRFDILGVHDFVDKPVEFPRLVEMIHRLAARRGWVRASDESP